MADFIVQQKLSVKFTDKPKFVEIFPGRMEDAFFFILQNWALTLITI